MITFNLWNIFLICFFMKNDFFQKKTHFYLIFLKLLHCTESRGVYGNINFSQKVANTPRVGHLSQVSRGFGKLRKNFIGNCIVKTSEFKHHVSLKRVSIHNIRYHWTSTPPTRQNTPNHPLYPVSWSREFQPGTHWTKHREYIYN